MLTGHCNDKENNFNSLFKKKKNFKTFSKGTFKLLFCEKLFITFVTKKKAFLCCELSNDFLNNIFARISCAIRGTTKAVNPYECANEFVKNLSD